MSNFDLPEWGEIKNNAQSFIDIVYWKYRSYNEIDGSNNKNVYMNKKWKKISKKSFYQSLLFYSLVNVLDYNKKVDSLEYELKNNYKEYEYWNMVKKTGLKSVKNLSNHSYFYLHIINNDYNILNFERGNFFQTQLRNIVVGIVLIFSDDSYDSYRFADALCTSFYPSYLSNTNTFIMEDMTYYFGNFNRLEEYTDAENTVISKEEVIHYTGKESSDIGWIRNGLHINTLVKYLRYILSFLTLMIIFFVIKKIKKKRISNEI